MASIVPRYGGSKVRSGCITCKARHVKCDEGRPSCQRCVKSRRDCGGYAPPEPRPAEQDQDGLSFIIYVPQPRRSPDSFPGFNSQEKRHFDFFRNCTAPELAGPFTSEIWSTILLQAAHAKTAIMHAVIALGALHETFGQENDAHAATSEFAMQHYGRAIRRVIDLDFASSSGDFDVVLMTCIVFAAFESLRGHYKLALTHITSGVNILTETDNYGELRRGFLPRHIFLPIFIRLENQLTEIDEKSTSPKVKHLPQQASAPIPHAFASVNDAEVAFDLFLNHLWRLLASPSEEASVVLEVPPLIEIQAHMNQYSQVLQCFADWCIAFDRSRFPPSHPAVLILQANRSMLEILQKAMPCMDEIIWDCYTSQFDDLLAYVEALVNKTNTVTDRTIGHHQQYHHYQASGVPNRPTFTFNLGVITPLYFTCTRCRDPTIRRRALRILFTCNRKEGIWDSIISARIAERIIAIEEAEAQGVSDSTVVLDACQIPEHARVRESDVFFATGRQGRIKYLKSGTGREGKISEPKFEEFAW